MQPNASVIVFMRCCMNRAIAGVLCDLSFGEIQGRNHQDPVHPGDAENPAREFHERTPMPPSYLRSL
jgi:hypothetical protein